MKQLVGVRKGKLTESELILLPLLDDETWHIEGDFVIISANNVRLYGIRIPSDVQRIEVAQS